MTSTRDIQDMLGISAQSSPMPKPAKKGKNPGERRTGGRGLQSELKSLIGERAPPAILTQQPPLYKERPKMDRPVRKWQFTPFKNDARTDDLMLRHWRMQIDPAPAAVPATNGEEQADHEMNGKPDEENSRPRQQYGFAKYDVKVEAPEFDPETYEAHLKSEEWSEEETKYLMDVYNDFYGKWPLITDRYEWQHEQQEDEKMETTEDTPQKDGTSVPKKPRRGMEDLKARFYEVSAKLMPLKTPLSQMNATEHHNYEIMQDFKPHAETVRKRHREAQMLRSKEEKREEEYLIAELKRIYFRQERLDAELRELRSRVDHSITDDKSTTAFNTSEDIMQLLQRMGAQEKRNKPRRSLPGEGGMAPSPTTGAHGASGTPAQKKGTTTGDTTPGILQQQLPPRARARYGVSYHDRLQSGVTFRGDKIVKARTPSKSTVQNKKLGEMLAELGIPDVLQMQTQVVCEALEKLTGKLNTLLDVRKAREKEENEALVVRKQVEVKTGESQVDPGEEDTKPAVNDEAEQDGEGGEDDGDEGDDGEEDGEDDADDQDDEEEGGEDPAVKTEEREGSQEVSAAESSRPGTAQTRNGKRSASVLSAASGLSGQTTKRQKMAR